MKYFIATIVVIASTAAALAMIFGTCMVMHYLELHIFVQCIVGLIVLMPFFLRLYDFVEEQEQKFKSGE